MPELLCRPLALTALTSTALSPANLLLDRLGRAATFPAGTSQATFDLGAATSIDTIALIATNAAAGATWTITLSNNADMSAPVRTIAASAINASADALRRVHRQGLKTFAATNARYVRITVTTAVALQAGRLVVGKSFQPSEQRDYGWDFKVVDSGEAKRTSTGLDDIAIRGKVLALSWIWSSLTEAEARGTLLDLVAYAGETRDLLVCLDTAAADVHNLIGYGKLADPVIAQQLFEDTYEAKCNLQSRLILAL